MAVVKNRALGDTIISLGTLRFLHSILPKTEIFYFVPDWTEPLFKNTNFSAAQIVGFKMQSPGDWFSTFRTMRKLDIDCVLELSQSGRTSVFFDLYSSIFRIPYFFHNHHSKVGRVRDQGVQKAIIQRDLDAAWTYFGWLQRIPVPNYLDYAPDLGLMDVRKVKRVILGVVATRETKMYPLEKYAEIARYIKTHDHEIEIVAPLSDSPEDNAIAEKLMQLRAPITPVTRPLSELPNYFKEAMIYIGNDTGLKHLAVAAGIPTITLFGPEPPVEWHPYDKKLHPYFFRHPLPCRYETGKTYCPLSKCASMICLKEIPAAGVWEKAKELLYNVHSESDANPVDMGHTQTGFTPNPYGRSKLSMPEALEKTMVAPQAPLKPIELERTTIHEGPDDAVDLGQNTAVTTIKKRGDDDPDDDDEKTTVI